MTDNPTPRPAASFVGDHLALDFLNTRSSSAGPPIEWLRNGADLLDWLQQAGAIDAAVAARFGADTAALDAVAQEARGLREWLRPFVQRHAGRELGAVTDEELAPLNALLARDDSHLQVATGDAQPRTVWQRRVRRWTSPDQLLQPLGDAIADLLSNADFRLVRTCEGPTCSIMFLDRTKAHARRWCSMSVCGNRAKVAAHRARNAGARRQRQAGMPTPSAGRDGSG
jgi:predicted RNA-binding Zn ribbon-like protein